MLSIVKASIVNYKSLNYDGWNITVDPKELYDMLPFKKVCVRASRRSKWKAGLLLCGSS